MNSEIKLNGIKKEKTYPVISMYRTCGLKMWKSLQEFITGKSFMQ